LLGGGCSKWARANWALKMREIGSQIIGNWQTKLEIDCPPTWRHWHWPAVVAHSGRLANTGAAWVPRPSPPSGANCWPPGAQGPGHRTQTGPGGTFGSRAGDNDGRAGSKEGAAQIPSRANPSENTFMALPDGHERWLPASTREEGGRRLRRRRGIGAADWLADRRPSPPRGKCGGRGGRGPSYHKPMPSPPMPMPSSHRPIPPMPMSG
jgi:hypothetical protein